MRIHLANFSQQKIGGGWTFLNTFCKYGIKAGAEMLTGPHEQKKGDVFFISGATMVERAAVYDALQAGMKIVLRVDNIPRNSRNRNTGTSRLKEFAGLADLVIYQSNFSKDYVGGWLKKDGPVIINGADTEVFNPGGSARPKDGQPQFLFTQYNRDETKRWHEAWFEFIMQSRRTPESHLWIVGNFSPENLEYKFDFFAGEKHEYLGAFENPEDMAEVMRGADFLYLPYYNDACSQTLVEFLNCGKTASQVLCNQTGGNPDILQASPEQLTASYMTERYLAEIAKIL